MRIVSVLAALMIIVTSLMVAFTGAGVPEQPEPGVRETVRSTPVDPDIWPMYMGERTHQGYSDSSLPLMNNTDILWGVRVESLMGTVSPVVHEGVVYLGSGNGHMRGYDIDSGEVVWDVHIGNHRIRAAAAVDGENIYFGADNGHLYGFRISDRNKILDIDLGGSEIESSPLVVNGTIYVGVVGAFLRNHRFHAVDIATQSINWTLSMGDLENYYGYKETAAYWNGNIYIGDGNGSFFCLDADGFWDGNDGPYDFEENTSLTDPDIIWMVEGPYSITTDAMIAEGNVYYGNVVGRFFCRDALTGEDIWNKVIGRGERGLQSCPTYNDGRIYMTARNTVGVFEGSSVFSLDASTGAQIWRFNITGQIITESAPVLIDGALVFGSRNFKLYCLSTIEENIADEDRIFWSVSTGSPITSTPAVAEGRVFVANEPMGSFGKLFAVGAPDPAIREIWTSDPAPYIGEKVLLGATLWNNATVNANVDIEFKVSTLNFSAQRIVGVIEDVPVTAGEETVVDIEWTVEKGFDFFAALIKTSLPEDRNTDNNVASSDLFIKTPLTGYWTATASGPSRTAGAGQRLESNRSFWEMDLGQGWSGRPDDIWYDDLNGNGTISSTGSSLYLTGPEGDLISLNGIPGADGVPEISWRYSNSSVNMMGRPTALVDSERSRGGPNRIFSYGDDGAIWAFDWVGFEDGINDGPFKGESETGEGEGDIVWRTEVASPPSAPPLVSGGNLIFPLGQDTLVGLDDDTGRVLWSRQIFPEGSKMASDLDTLYIASGESIMALDPNTGVEKYAMTTRVLPYDQNVTSVMVRDDELLLSFSNVTALFDKDPAEDGRDEGEIDNATGTDLIWYHVSRYPLESPPAVSPDTESVGLVSGSTARFLHLNNGTEISNVSLQEGLSGRIVSGGDSFYLVTGTSPWTVRAFSPSENGILEPTWTMDLAAEPRGELVVVGDHMYISMRDGRILSIGAENNDPVAVISSPMDDILLFPGEKFTADASGSYDLDDDPITYFWYIEGQNEPLFEGPDPITELSLDGIGKKKLVLRVYDDMRAFSETYVNITLLKRITSPDFQDFLYDINIHMSYGISEASGRGLVNVTVNDEAPEATGAVFICRLQFLPLPSYASYRFEFANISIEYADKEFDLRLNEEKMRLYFYDQSLSEWVRAPTSGVDLNGSVVYGNFSALRSGYYAIGILDNSIPELRHREAENYRYRMLDSTRYKFRVEYRDSDDDKPIYVKMVLDNRTDFELADEGFATSVLRWAFFSVEDVQLSPGQHSYYFETSDGNFIVRSDHFSYFVENNPPVVRILGPTSVVNTGDVVLFDGSGSTDPDGDELTFSWDFDRRDGIQKDQVGPKVDHVYTEEGNYMVTLTVSDGISTVSKTINITVMYRGEEERDPIPTGIWVLILVVIAIFILAIVVFIIVSRRGLEEESDLQRKFEGRWTCPECGTRVPNGVEECPRCDYIYDPLDFDESDMDVIEEM